MHHYQHNIGDYAKKTSRLSLLQHGVYRTLMDCIYDRERFPTREEAEEWVWASTAEEIEALDFVLRRFFEQTNRARFVQKRIRQEFENYVEKANKNRKIAWEREENRAAKREDREPKQYDPLTDRNRLVYDSCTERVRTVGDSPPNQEPVTSNQEPITNNHNKNLLSPPAAPASTESGKPPPDPDYLRMAEAMAQRIQPLTKQTKPPNLDQWADDIRKLVEIDKRDLRTVAEVFQWANTDDFWQTNILSPAKLRKQFPMLYAKFTATTQGQDFSAIAREAYP